MKIKIALVDLLIIALVLLFCIALFFKMPQQIIYGAKDDGIPVSVDITLKTEISDEYIDGVSVGDVVVDVSSGRLIGRISDIEYSDLIVHNALTDTDLAFPEYKDAKITVRAEAQQNGDFISIAGRRLVIGEKYDLVTPGFAFEGSCISVSENLENHPFNAQHTR